MVDKDMYDLILMDIELPGMNGIETSLRIKAKPGYSKTPIIAITAFAMKGTKKNSLMRIYIINIKGELNT